MKYIMKMIKYLKELGLLIKIVSETIEKEVKEQKGRFLSMLMDTLSANLMGNMLASKGFSWAGEGTVKAGQEYQY